MHGNRTEYNVVRTVVQFELRIEFECDNPSVTKQRGKRCVRLRKYLKILTDHHFRFGLILLSEIFRSYV